MLGLGHDVVDVGAFGEQLGLPGSRMRGLFSARELRPYTIDAFPWPDIEILDDSHGVPHVSLPPEVRCKLRESLGSPQCYAIHISLSHDGAIASAVAYITAGRG